MVKFFFAKKLICTNAKINIVTNNKHFHDYLLQLSPNLQLPIQCTFLPKKIFCDEQILLQVLFYLKVLIGFVVNDYWFDIPMIWK